MNCPPAPPQQFKAFPQFHLNDAPAFAFAIKDRFHAFTRFHHHLRSEIH
jgi:hypothetical protein